MSSNALVTFGAIITSVVLFSVPLVLKYHVYRTESKHVVVGDVIPVDGRLSSVWCQGVELESESKFESYIYDSFLEVDESRLQRSQSVHRMILPTKAQEFWGFHLLRGSIVNLTSCARLIRADVTIVKGFIGLKQCLQEYKKKEYADHTSVEDSLSLSESDEDTSSISSSQGVVTNETDMPYICTNALHHVELPTSYKCKHPFSHFSRQHTLSQRVLETDYYFYIFSSNSYLDLLPNEFSIKFIFDRTHYNHSSSYGNCSTNNHCYMDIPIGWEHKIVVEMDERNGTLKTEKVQMTCKPRKWIFLIFYALFLLVIFICAFQ